MYLGRNRICIIYLDSNYLKSKRNQGQRASQYVLWCCVELCLLYESIIVEVLRDEQQYHQHLYAGSFYFWWFCHVDTLLPTTLIHLSLLFFGSQFCFFLMYMPHVFGVSNHTNKTTLDFRIISTECSQKYPYITVQVCVVT